MGLVSIFDPTGKCSVETMLKKTGKIKHMALGFPSLMKRIG